MLINYENILIKTQKFVALMWPNVKSSRTLHTLPYTVISLHDATVFIMLLEFFFFIFRSIRLLYCHKNVSLFDCFNFVSPFDLIIECCVKCKPGFCVFLMKPCNNLNHHFVFWEKKENLIYRLSFSCQSSRTTFNLNTWDCHSTGSQKTEAMSAWLPFSGSWCWLSH